MGKRKIDVDADATGSREHRKHSKHRQRDKGYEESVPDDQPAIKLKIKIGGQTLGTTSFNFNHDEQDSQSSDANRLFGDDDISIAGSDSMVWDSSQHVDLAGCSTDDEEKEEREWLAALEAGELDDNGDLKRGRDPSVLTCRQRALLHGQQHGELLELPLATKRSESMTEEQLKRRQLKAKRRKEKALEKNEKDKKETLDRLLKKQECKPKGQPKESSCSVL